MKNKPIGKAKPRTKVKSKKTKQKALKKIITIPLAKVSKILFVFLASTFGLVILYFSFLVLKSKVNNVVVKEINIVNASDYVVKYLTKELDFIKGKKVSEIDIHEVKRYVLSIDWILAASVRKDYTGSLSIKVVEPTPYFLWVNNGSVLYINSNKKVVRRFNRNLDKDLIEIYEGEEALRELDLLRFVVYKDLDVLRVIDKLVYNGYRWDIFLDNGIKIMLPEHNLDVAWDNILYFNDEYQVLSRNVKSIDARILDRVLIIPNEPEI